MVKEDSQLIKQLTMDLPKRILFGVGSFEKIGEEVSRLGSHVLMVIDPVVKKLGVADKARKLVEQRSVKVQIFDGIEPEPSIEVARKLTKTVRDKDFDLVLGIGGGSSLDLAKMASVMATNPGDPGDYFGGDKIKKPRLRLLLAPTTAGTGSEMSSNYVLTAEGLKLLTLSPVITADTALVDPVLTLTMPPKTTASTGLDALAHAIESMLSVLSNDLTDAIDLEAVRLIGKYLRIAYRDGQNLEARSGMSLAAMTTGFAFANVHLIIAHGVGMQLGSSKTSGLHLAHGEGCAVALPYAMQYNLSVSAGKLARIARALGEDVEKITEERAAWKAIYAVHNLIKDVGMSTNLKDLGLEKAKLGSLVNDLMTTWKFVLDFNPRPSTKESLLKYYESIWAGKIGEAAL